MLVRFGVASAFIAVLVSFVAPAAAQTQGSCLIQKKRSRTEQKMAVVPEQEVPPQGSAHSRFSQLRERIRHHNGDGARHFGGAPLKRRKPIGETSLLGLHRAFAAPDPRHSLEDLGKRRPDDQPRDQPSQGDVEPDIVESPYKLQKGLVVVETSSADDSYSAMDISSLCSQPSPQVLIIATASKGLWDEEYGLMHEPLEAAVDVRISYGVDTRVQHHCPSYTVQELLAQFAEPNLVAEDPSAVEMPPYFTLGGLARLYGDIDLRLRRAPW